MDVDSAKKFTFENRGPLYAMPACEIMGFVNTKYQDPKEDRPDIQIFLTSFADSSDGGTFSTRASGMSNDYYSEVYENIIFQDAVLILPLLMRPRSRGKILLKDANPRSHPRIIPNYYADPRDLEIMVRIFFSFMQFIAII